MKPTKIPANILSIIISVLCCVALLAIIGKLDDFAKAPITTTLLIGFYFKDALISWGLAASIGWLAAIAVEGYLAYVLFNLFNLIYQKTKKTFKSSKKS